MDKSWRQEVYIDIVSTMEIMIGEEVGGSQFPLMVASIYMKHEWEFCLGSENSHKDFMYLVNKSECVSLEQWFQIVYRY